MKTQKPQKTKEECARQQTAMLYASIRKQGEKNRAFMEMITDPVNPMTNKMLEALIARFPERYSCYSGFIGKLQD